MKRSGMLLASLLATACALTVQPAVAQVRTVADLGPSARPIASGPSGALYAVDPPAVRQIAGDGTTVRTWGTAGTGDGQFSNPTSIAVSPVSGDVYVGDGPAGGGRVQEFTSTGTFVRSWTTTRAPGGLAVDADGNVYSVDGIIEKRTASGTLISSWPMHGNTYPGGLAVDATSVYSPEGLVSKYTLDGAFLGTFPDWSVSTVAMAGDRVLAAQSSTAVLSFATTGALLARWSPAIPDHPYLRVDYLAVGGNDLYLTACCSGGNELLLRVGLTDPVARVSGPATAATGEPVTFDASGSAIPLSTENQLHYEWDLDGDGTFETDTGSDPHASIAYATTGTHTINVRVSGGTGSDTASTGVQVSDSSAALGASKPLALTGDSIDLDASASHIAGATEQYAWDLDGDGTFERSTGTTAKTSVAVTTPGMKTFSVQVTRPGGRVDRASTTVDVRPAPPSGPIGISINNGSQFTNTPDVNISVIWPALTQTVLLSNDGGFQPSQSVSVATQVPWHLDSSGPERLPKTVYARFDGGTQTFQDDIILDETPPTLASASLASTATTASVRAESARLRTYRLSLKASDGTSGVASYQYGTGRKPPKTALDLPFAARPRLHAKTAPTWVRVRDRAGNYSRWRAVKRTRAH